MCAYSPHQFYDRLGSTMSTHTEAGSQSLRYERQRAHWSAEGDALFVSILAKHSTLDEQEGLITNHRHIDPAIIDDISRALGRNVAVEDLVQEMAIKYPNKKVDGRSYDSIALIIEMKRAMPKFTHLQLNHKHINMWTRTIYPFCTLSRTGELFRGKSVFHKDNKRFIKVLMEFISYVIANGLRGVDPDLFGRKVGRGTKLLEQWLAAMLKTHRQRMANFLYKCGIKLACLYIRSKLAAERSPEENAFLESTSFTPKAVQTVLKEYMEQISNQEHAERTMPFQDTDALDSAATDASLDDGSNVDVADAYTDDRNDSSLSHSRMRPPKQQPLRSLRQMPELRSSPATPNERTTGAPAAYGRPMPPLMSTYNPYTRPLTHDVHTFPRHNHPRGSFSAYHMHPSPSPYDGYTHRQAPPTTSWRQMTATQHPVQAYPQNARQPESQPHTEPHSPVAADSAHIRLSRSEEIATPATAACQLAPPLAPSDAAASQASAGDNAKAPV
ncbi:hypothetical protein H4R21_000438 [Coemansia helicoidea]|uniref:Uncharacterized protein n=1 Tax=Coemansia helicoidea TaxID=1286919 RepID=A0ACC1LH99_9FUNG|nr:hypothetical protein H4R21_000438 [Coemansia helicoidea]